jgi:hypothetical protein
VSASLERLVVAALEWQEATDEVVGSAPLPADDPLALVLVARATEAHMTLLHVCRALRSAGGGS